MSVKKRGLGRGLDALLTSSAAPQADEAAGDELRELAVDSLVPGKHQPRRHFDEAALQSLAESIRAQGVVQPIVVRIAGGGRYEIVAGERRWRASKLAGLAVIPAIIRPMEDRTAMAVALVENIQRADLNPLEEAEALRRLIDDCALTHEAAAGAVGRSRAAVSNLLRLLDLHADVQTLVRDGALSLGHAKVLLAAAQDRQPGLARQVIDRQLTVRQTEVLVQAAPDASAATIAADAASGKASGSRLRSVVDAALSSRIGARVEVRQTAGGSGKLVIAFSSDEQLQRVLTLLR